MLISDEHGDAARIADAAGYALLAIRTDRLEPDDSRGLGARGDRESHRLILDMLEDEYPQDPVLSEEGEDNLLRLASRRVWIVDPLDGTREYGEPGRTDWAVHVALAVDGEPVAGAVALPALGLTMSTGQPSRLPPTSHGPLRIVVSRSRAPGVAFELARLLQAEIIEMGSAGAKTMAVVRGDADAYVHAGGQYEWDSAAPIAVAMSTGLHVSRLDGSRLIYNRRNPRLPDQLVCRPELADRILKALEVCLHTAGTMDRGTGAFARGESTSTNIPLVAGSESPEAIGKSSIRRRR
jgi:3'(2'), 5'-bisphosphate nucleotidase